MGLGLRENLEMTHTFVRQNTGVSIQRQKRYYDRKTRFENFEVNDNVYVLFPVKQVGLTAKFCSFWRGPFQIKERLCDVLFVVNCGRNGTYQVIHIDRIKRAKSQTLHGEADLDESLSHETNQTNEADLQTESLDITEEEEEDNVEPETYSRYGRQRQKPIWTKDYVFSIFRSTMANEKKTARKHQWCNNCRKMILSELFISHQLLCARNRKACNECGATFSKMCYLIRHRKNFHAYQQEFIKPSKEDKSVKPIAQTKTVALPSDKAMKKTWDKDPDIELGETNENELLKGRVFRKNVCPNPVFAPNKRKVETVSRAPSMSDSENESAESSVGVDDSSLVLY